jgi:hypothetical protein
MNTELTEAQKWLQENIESGAWRDQPRGVWTARHLFQIINDHSCGDHTYCAFTGEHGRSGAAQRVNWDDWEAGVAANGEELNPRLEYPTAPNPFPAPSREPELQSIA